MNKFVRICLFALAYMVTGFTNSLVQHHEHDAKMYILPAVTILFGMGYDIYSDYKYGK